MEKKLAQEQEKLDPNSNNKKKKPPLSKKDFTEHQHMVNAILR